MIMIVVMVIMREASRGDFFTAQGCRNPKVLQNLELGTGPKTSKNKYFKKGKGSPL